jgi:transposase
MAVVGKGISLAPCGLIIERIESTAEALTIFARPTSESAACPHCGHFSQGIHSRYQRLLSDLPSQGKLVWIKVQARRFHCGQTDCGQQIFVERLDVAVTRAFARRTSRLEGLVHHLDLALGGRPGQSFARRLLLPVSKDTLLRVVRRHAAQPASAPRVVGIDDWAWKRGRRYGTVVCDLEKRRIVDILPDREATTVTAWLSRHPSITVIARDRGAGYKQAATDRRPEAVQVADRWHLMENASAAFLNAVRRSMHAIRKAVGVGVVDPASLSAAERRQPAGWVLRQVVRGARTDMFRSRMSSLDPFLMQLEAAWAGGCHNGAALWRAMKAVGFIGGLRVVTEWATRKRKEEGTATRDKRPTKAPPARRIARMMTTDRDKVSRSTAATIAMIGDAVPDLTTARDLLDRFHRIIQHRSDANLDAWIADAKPGLMASFVSGIVQDFAAVKAALTEPWPTGQTEGQNTKLKLVERQMYGRAGLDLLRARLLGAT